MKKNNKDKSFFKRHHWKPALGILCTPLFIGLIPLIVGISHYSKEQEIAKWPSVTGTIVESRITQHIDDEGEDYYQPYYIYEYKVDGVKFKNDVYSVSGDTTGYYLKGEAIESKFKTGTKVNVFYNPKDPTNSYMHRAENTPTGTWILIILGVVLIGIGLILSCMVFFSE